MKFKSLNKIFFYGHLKILEFHDDQNYFENIADSLWEEELMSARTHFICVCLRGGEESLGK